MRRSLLAPALITITMSIGASIGLPAAPAAAAVSPAVRVSGATPYAGCQVPLVGGTLYPEAEVEPSVSADPAHPARLVGVWQQDRFSNGGARGLVAGYSR